MRARTIAAIAGIAIAMTAPVNARQPAGWDSLHVPGGRATLEALGVDAWLPRSAIMTDVIRRLHFTTSQPHPVAAAVRKIPTAGTDALVLPLPLTRAMWQKVIFRRDVAESRLFFEILNDSAARLLYHGLAGLDVETRRWFEGQPDVLQSLYRTPDAVESFAVFGPAIRIAGGRVQVPGGVVGERRWAAALGARVDDPVSFVSRLFHDREGRAAGLYFLVASVGPARQRFLLDAAAESGAGFERLVSAFSSCYPRDSNDYPFVLRSKDAASLLLSIGLTESGEPAGPRSRDFWHRVFESDDLVSVAPIVDRRAIDASWLVERLCASSASHRTTVFATLLAGHRAFASPADDTSDVVLALRVRRLFPSVFAAMEHAGIRVPSTYASIARHALALDRLNDPAHAAVALQQFQGALSIVLGAGRAGTLTEVQMRRLLAVLVQARLRDGRYDGDVARWLDRELRPALGGAAAASLETAVAQALAGPPLAPPIRVRWEDLEYVLDYSASTRDRLLQVRKRQGGATLDGALQLALSASGPEAIRAADAVLAQALASWTYAPHLGTADGGAFVGGDPSTRHDLGIRVVNRTRFEQRWELIPTAGDRGAVAGSLLGLHAALANWSLRRLTSDIIPAPPTMSDSDRTALQTMVALADPRAFTDAEMREIALAIGRGGRAIDAAAGDAVRLDALAAAAAISPWRRAALPWMAVHEPDRVASEFTIVERARLGGVVRTTPAWGTSAVPLGCLCLTAAEPVVPEVVAGRPVDGMVGAVGVDLMFRIAALLTELDMPAALTPAVSAYAMRDFIDRARPSHPADAATFARQASLLTRSAVEDYIGAIAAVGPLRPVAQ